MMACGPSFDMDDKVGCTRDRDCLSGEICVLPSNGGGLGVCARDRDAGRTPEEDVGLRPPTTPGSDVQEDSVCHAPSCTPDAAELDVCQGHPVDLQSSREHCGQCDTPCAPPQATGVCLEGVCVVQRCEPGFVNLDGASATGCEASCNDGGLWCGDFEDRSCERWGPGVGLCGIESALEGRSYFLYRWSIPAGLAWGGLVDVGRATFTSGTLSAGALRRADLRLPARGQTIPAELWQASTPSADGLLLRNGDASLSLRVPRQTDAAMLIGVEVLPDEAGRAMWVLIEEEEILPRRLIDGEHVLWLVSPWSERAQLEVVQEMAWASPAQIPLLRLSSPRWGAATEATVPIVETRTEVRGTLNATQTQVRTRTQQFSSGVFEVAFFRQGRQQSQPDKLLSGQATRDGFLALGAARFGRSWCPVSYHRVGEDCIHDPTLFVSVQRTQGTQVSSGAYNGTWRLVGWSTRTTEQGLMVRSMDAELGFSGANVVGAKVQGTLDRYPQGAAPIPGALRLQLTGEGIPEGAMELEGHVDPDQRYGVFWDQSGDARSLRGSLFFLLRQEP